MSCVCVNWVLASVTALVSPTIALMVRPLATSNGSISMLYLVASSLAVNTIILLRSPSASIALTSGVNTPLLALTMVLREVPAKLANLMARGSLFAIDSSRVLVTLPLAARTASLSVPVRFVMAKLTVFVIVCAVISAIVFCSSVSVSDDTAIVIVRVKTLTRFTALAMSSALMPGVLKAKETVPLKPFTAPKASLRRSEFMSLSEISRFSVR